VIGTRSGSLLKTFGAQLRFGWVGLCLILFAGRMQAQPAMWVVHGKDSTTYLVGTVHLLRRESEWKNDKLTKALADSKELWLEISDPDNQSAIVPLLQKYGYDREKPLSTRLTAKQKENLQKLEKEYNVPETMLEPMRPWLAALMLAVLPLQKAGFDPNAGVEHSLKQQADKEGDKVVGFETLEQQIRLLAELPETDQVAFFNDTLDDASQGVALFDKLADAWLKGDTKTIADVFVDEVKTKTPSIYQKMLVDRNVRWADRIAELQKTPGVRLIGVGAGHLVGADSVQVQLAKKGIKADPY
jgi:uncharacterized protein